MYTCTCSILLVYFHFSSFLHELLIIRLLNFKIIRPVDVFTTDFSVVDGKDVVRAVYHKSYNTMRVACSYLKHFQTNKKKLKSMVHKYANTATVTVVSSCIVVKRSSCRQIRVM